jgi:hypothetical protein
MNEHHNFGLALIALSFSMLSLGIQAFDLSGYKFYPPVMYTLGVMAAIATLVYFIVGAKMLWSK